MAISFQTSVTGGKTTTTGTTATLALSSTAGDLVIVAIAYPSTSVSISSVTDGGGNTYHQVGKIANGTLTVELWKTDKVNAAASGTITITMSGTGSRMACVAGSYRNVAYAGNPSQTATGAASPASTGALSLNETNSWIVSSIGRASSGTYTATSGSLRNQLGTTGIAAALMDSNDGASPVTMSATLSTSAAWATVSVELRLLEVTQLEDNSSNWADKYADNMHATPITLALSDDGSSNWQDPTFTQQFEFDSIVNQSMNFWADNVNAVLQSAGGLTLTLTDNLNNWADFVAVGYGSLTSDQLVIADSLGAGYGAQLSDTLNNWNDVLRIGYGLAIPDSMTMSDAIAAGYGSGITDQLILTDFAAVGYGASTSDQLILSDSLTAGYGAQLSDNLNNWNDAVTSRLSIALTLADNLNNWNDFVGVGYGNVIADQLSMSDFVSAGYGTLTSDQLVLTDSLGAGYGALLNDNLNNWNDVVVDVLSFEVRITQSLNGYAEGLTVGYGNAIPDTMTMSDFTAAGYGAAASDQIVISDSIGAGYGALLSDNLNNWNDLVQTFLAGALLSLSLSDNLNNWQDVLSIGYGDIIADAMTVSDFVGAGYGSGMSDSMNNWTDTLGAGYGNTVADQMSLSDKLAAGYGAGIADQIVIVDSMNAGYGFLLSDNLNNWQDVVQTFLAGALLSLSLSDNLNNWNDFVAAGYGNAASDQLVISDSLGAGYGAALSDTLNNWSDLVAAALSFEIHISLTINGWADFVGAGYGLLNSDQVVISDSMGAGYGFVLSDSLNNWNDVLTTNLISSQLTLTLSDNLNNWQDFMAAGYGLATNDQVVLADSVSAGYGAALADSITTWQDQARNVLSFEEKLADNASNWTDVIGVGYGLLCTDTAAMLDSLTTGYGAGLSDSMGLADALGAGYGFVFTDSLNFWQDLIAISSGSVMLLDLHDSNTNWLDDISTRIINFGGIPTVHSVVVSPHTLLGSTSAQADTVFSDATSNCHTVFTYSSTSLISLTLQLVDDNGANWQDSYASSGGTTALILNLTDDIATWQDAFEMTVNGVYLMNFQDDASGNWNDIVVGNLQ